MDYGIIIAGGSGTRFWPKSTKENPKQLLPLNSDKPLILETYERFLSIFPKENIFILTNKALQNKIAEIIPNVQFIIEPCSKNTAPAIGLACIELLKRDPEATLFVQPSDHIYSNQEKYRNYAEQALGLAKENKIVVMGIRPTYPSLGFGYIKHDKPFKWGYEVECFKEKPDLQNAKAFLQSGEYLWNSGMYIFKAKKMLEEFEKHQPETYSLLLQNKFEEVPSNSIDFAISEKTKDLVMIRAEMPWDDMGSWDSLERTKKQDDMGNTIVGKHIGIDSKDNIIFSEKLIATIGVQNLTIVQTKDATLVCTKDRLQDIKELVKRL
jgi:mannose-1-phosphate guanylyltransferase